MLSPNPPASQRLDALDILRGFALFGILVVNLPFFAQPIYRIFTGTHIVTWYDQAAAALVALLFEAKFYVLFAWLFGYGLATQLARASSDQVAPGPRFARRLVGLLLFGVLHATLLFVGDILVSYVILGALFWLLREWTDRGLLRFAAVMLGVAVLGRLVLAFAQGTSDPAATVQLDALAAEAQRNYLGTFAMAAEQRVNDLVVFYLFTPFFNWPTILAMFALGLVAGRHGLLRDSVRFWGLARRALPWAALVGLGGNLLYVVLFYGGFANAADPLVSALALSAEAIGAPALTFCYVCGILWLAQQPTWGRLLAPLRFTGRMSLTNYLAQAIICSFLFNGWGLGLYGQPGPLACLLLAPLIYSLQLGLSALWLRYFRVGPDEWLLRSWTYLRWQPWRVRPQLAAGQSGD
ncbi:MAG: DUF418 domain-containing protein [Chloroflexaceae bacterium]|jgi:uncharacterized protein|nr:DUF418 domain-containing protein [Chloroflexaceae bacterium]